MSIWSHKCCQCATGTMREIFKLDAAYEQSVLKALTYMGQRDYAEGLLLNLWKQRPHAWATLWKEIEDYLIGRGLLPTSPQSQSREPTS